MACARILPKDTNYPEISIGRVIVALNYRGKNVGHALMEYCINQIDELYGKQNIVLSAQAHLQEFYKKHNFVPVGDTYLEDGIPHIKMKRNYTSNSSLWGSPAEKKIRWLVFLTV